jgi:hypothetical protein
VYNEKVFSTPRIRNNSEFGNSAKIIVPGSWLGRRVIAFLHSEYISKHPEDLSKEDE